MLGKSLIDRSSNNLGYFHSVIGHHRVMSTRNCVNIHPSLRETGPAKVGNAIEIRLVSIQSDSHWPGFRDVSVQQTPIAAPSLVKSIALAHLFGFHYPKLANRQLSYDSDTLTWHAHDSRQHLSYEFEPIPIGPEISSQDSPGRRQFGVEQNDQLDFFAFIYETPGNFEDRNSLHTIAAQQIRSLWLNLSQLRKIIKRDFLLALIVTSVLLHPTRPKTEARLILAKMGD